MVKSYRNIKSGLDLSREQKVLCRTSMKEAEIFEELESRYGNFTENILKRDTIRREKIRRLRQTQFLERARMRLFINKVMRSSLQNERLKPLEHMETQETKSTQTDSPSEGDAKFRRIELTY